MFLLLFITVLPKNSVFLWDRERKKKFVLTPGGYSDMKLVYICHTGFKNGGLRERPLTENGWLSERPFTGRTGDFGAKITKKRIFFFFFFENDGLFDLSRSEKRNKELYIFEEGVFWSGPCRKSSVFRSGQGRKIGGGGGGGVLSRGTYLYCPYMGVPNPQVPTYRPSMNILNKQQTNIFLNLAIHIIK